MSESRTSTFSHIVSGKKLTGATLSVARTAVQVDSEVFFFSRHTPIEIEISFAAVKIGSTLFGREYVSTSVSGVSGSSGVRVMEVFAKNLVSVIFRLKQMSSSVGSVGSWVTKSAVG